MVEWRPVPDFEDRYEVSNDGRVRSLKYRRMPCMKELKLARTRGGYLFVTLQAGAKKRAFRIGRLVAEVFIRYPTKLETVNHIDGNIDNNLCSNLEWVTQAENTKHARLVLGRGAIDVPVEVTRPDGQTFTFGSQAEAARTLGLDNAAVNRTANGGLWQHEGPSRPSP